VTAKYIDLSGRTPFLHLIRRWRLAGCRGPSTPQELHFVKFLLRSGGQDLDALGKREVLASLRVTFL